MRRQLKLPIPVSIITGALGVGKTTALCHVVQQKPPDEVWCIIVNEFGAVGIDAAAIESSAAASSNRHAPGSVTVRQLAGGCMCCVLAGPLSAAIAQIIRATKPDRVIIEPSGLGHPGGLLDILQGPHLGTSLRVNAVICLVDLTRFAGDRHGLLAAGTAADQISIADVLVGSKADAAPAGAADAFTQWASDELFPVKVQVLVMECGRLEAALLDAPRCPAAGQLLPRQGSRARLQHAAAASTAAAAASTSEAASGGGAAASPGQPQRVVGGSASQQYSSCSLVFDERDVFDQTKLLLLLRLIEPAVARVKAVFRVAQKQWVMPVAPFADGQQQQQQDAPRTDDGLLRLAPVCYRGPSIVEVIVDSSSTPQGDDGLVELLKSSSGASLHWHQALENALVGCLVV